MPISVLKSSLIGERYLHVSGIVGFKCNLIFFQGYGRQGAAYHGLGDLKAAEASYRKGLEIEPGR